MKRVRCPKCDNFITFDETKYEAGQSLVFVCPNCNKQFGIRMGVSKLRETRKEEQIDENANENGVGSIVVIENVFAYKQVIPLQMGDNVIGTTCWPCLTWEPPHRRESRTARSWRWTSCGITWKTATSATA